MSLFSASPTFIWSANADGLAIRFSNTKHYANAKQGRANEAGQLGLIRMQMLAECGQAEVREVDAGIFIKAADAVRLDMETREGFLLPPAWPGGMRLQTESVPQSSNFTARIGLVDPGVQVIWDWKLRGPILEVSSEKYLPTAAQFTALSAFQQWQNAGGKTEFTHLSLIASLREAHLSGCMIDMEAYDDDRGAIIAHANELLINASEDEVTGDLVLCPLPEGCFGKLAVCDVETRLGQLDVAKERGVIRVGKTIVLLTETQTAQAKAIKARGRIPKAERATYERDPQAWLADHVFPDVSAEFSPRVTGIGEWQGGYVGGALGEPEDWFGKQPEAEKPDRPSDSESSEDGNGEGGGGTEPDSQNAVVVPLIIPNDEQLAYGWPFSGISDGTETGFQLDYQRFIRPPKDHQNDAIRWMLGHSRRALTAQKSQTIVRGFGAGALLADDMGLGKTYSTLVCLAEWMRHWRESTATEPPAVLVVAPLSLLENWKDEMVKTFKPEMNPFRRVVIAQGDGDLASFRRAPGARDINPAYKCSDIF